MKNSLKSILAIFLILTLFLGGCGSGGFSETTANGSSATDPGASNTVFLIGQVRVPITASQSLLRASVSTVALAGADIDLFRPDDVARQNSLLASGAQIEAGADGRFALLKSQIRSTELSGTAVLVAKSENLVFSTLMELPGANSVVKDAVKVDYRTDAAVRFLQEEILKNAARAQNQAEIREAPWSDTVDSLASRIATVRNDLEGFLSNLPYNPANHGSSSGGAGRLFRQVAQGQSALSLIVEEGVRLEARAALEPIRPDEITLAEKRLRLASQFLLAGFTLLGEDGSLLWNQRFSRLEFSALPPTGFGASEADLEASFGGLVTTSDVQKWPLPANTLHFTVQELSALRPLGQQYEEFSVLMAREISRLPWVSMPILENLLALPSKNLLRLDSLFQAFSLGFEQRTWSVERVLTGLDSGGRIVPGEKVSASGAFGGLSVNPSSRLSMVIGLNSESSLDTFRNRLREAPEFWMQWLPASFRMAHHRLNELSQNIASSQAIYPDPISESSARFEVVRTLNGIQQYGSAQAEQGMELLLREAQILRHMILSATDSRLSSETLVNRIEIPVLAEFFAQLSPAFEPSTGLFTSIASNQGKTPNLDNLSVLSFRPSATETMWNQIFLRAGQSGVAETKNPQLKAMETSLATLRVTTLNWLRTIPSQAQNVELQGKVIKGGNLAAARFLMRLESDNLTTVVAQTSSDGSFSIKNLPGDRFYRLVVEARDVDVQSNPQANLVTMSFDFWLSGYEPVVELSDILLAPSFNALASNPISDFSRIVPANFLATIQTKNPDPVVSGIIPLQVLVCDDETDLVDLKFGFTVGDSLLVTTQAPRISVSNLPTATFPADGILRNLPSRTNAVCLTQPFTYYWHSRQDYGLGGNLGNASQQDVRISFSVREIGRTTEFDVASISGFFDLDNESPNLTFTHPLSTDPATTLAAIRLAGTAFDVSAVKSIWVSNASLRSGRTTTYAARDLGSGFGTWEVLDFPVEPGIENTVHFFAEDIFGNRNALPRELKFLSLDSAPPLLKLTSITVLGARNIPVLESVESGSALTIATVALGGGSIRYELPLTSDRSYRFNLLTTGLVEFAGTAVDVSGVFRVRANSTGFAAQSTDSVSYSWKRQVNLGTESLPFGSDSTSLRVILSAIDTKNNDSRPLSFQTALQNRQSTLLYVNLLDIEAPGIAILQPEGGRNAQTVTTDLITIRAAATDASRIVSFSACSVIACTSFQPVTGTMDFIGVLPLMEATSNRLTGLIADEWGYAQTFTMTSPLTILNLNDISPPSLIVTSVSDALIQPQLLPLVVDRNTPDSPRSSIQVLEVTRCASTQPGVSPTSCSVTLSGIMSDASGFDFASDGRNNLSGFRLRMNALNSGQFNPDTAQTRQDLYGASTVIFPNVGNTSMIQAFPVTATPVQTQVPFTATLSLKDDGYWPVVLQLFDNSINLFSGHEKKSIEKREMIYVKRDTTGPVLSELSLISGGSVTSGRILLNGAATDALSAVTSVEVGGVQGSLGAGSLNLSPWRKFVNLPQLSSVSFSANPTMNSGASQSLPITGVDSFGNRTTMSLNLSVYPLHEFALSSTAQFDQPVNIGFTGTDGSSVAITDKNRRWIEVLDSKGELVRTLSGITGNAVYDDSRELSFTDIYRGTQGTLTLERVLLGGLFEKPAHEILNILSRFRPDGELESRTSAQLSTSSSGSLTPLTYVTGTLGRFTPEFDFVTHIYQPAAAGQNQLFRYVRSFRDVSPSTAPSEGGLTASTGLNGADLGSEVHTMVVTQVHVSGLGSLDDPQDSREFVYLSEPSRNRIAAFWYNNRFAGSGYRTTAPLNMPLGIEPTSFDLEPDGKILYVADRRNQKIHSFSVSGATLTTLTTYGGFGVRDGQFLSIDAIRGYKRPSQSGFESLYVVDSKAKRISILTTSGQFVRHLGLNPYGPGGFAAPTFLGDSDAGGILVMDASKEVVDSIGSQSEGKEFFTTSQFANSGNFALGQLKAISLSTTSVLTNQDKFTDPTFFTGSQTPLSISTRSLYAASPLTLFRSLYTESSTFTAISTNGGRLVLTTQAAPIQNYQVLTQGVQNFSGIVDFARDRDTEERVFVLEDIAGTDRLQMLSPDSGFQTLSTLSSQSQARFVCTMDAGLAILGQNPAHMVEYFAFGSVTRIVPAASTFQSLPLLNWQGTSADINAPTGLSCQNNLMAVAQNSRVDVFERRSDGFYQIQAIRSTDASLSSTDPLRTLSGPLDVGFSGDLLWVLEKERLRLHRYRTRP